MAMHSTIGAGMLPKCTFCALAATLEKVAWVDENLVQHLTNAVRANDVTLDQVLIWWPKAGRLVVDRLLASDAGPNSSSATGNEPVDLVQSPDTPPKQKRARTSSTPNAVAGASSSQGKRGNAPQSKAMPASRDVSPTQPFPTVPLPDGTQVSTNSDDPIENSQAVIPDAAFPGDTQL